MGGIVQFGYGIQPNSKQARGVFVRDDTASARGDGSFSGRRGGGRRVGGTFVGSFVCVSDEWAFARLFVSAGEVGEDPGRRGDLPLRTCRPPPNGGDPLCSFVPRPHVSRRPRRASGDASFVRGGDDPFRLSHAFHEPLAPYGGHIWNGDMRVIYFRGVGGSGGARDTPGLVGEIPPRPPHASGTRPRNARRDGGDVPRVRDAFIAVGKKRPYSSSVSEIARLIQTSEAFEAMWETEPKNGCAGKAGG